MVAITDNYVSVLNKLENMVAIVDNIFNKLFIDVLFELNNFCIIGVILLITVIILIGPGILAYKPINEGIKTVINLGVSALTGIALANAANGRDMMSDGKKKKKKKKNAEEDKKNAEEKKRAEAEKKKNAEEDKKKQKLKMIKIKKEKEKVDDKFINNNYKHYKHSYILG